MKNRKSIILVFNEEEIKCALKLKAKTNDENIVIVPWSVMAYDYLDLNKIDYYDISNEFSQNNKLTRYEWHLFIIKYKQWCLAIDQIIFDEVEVFRKIELKIFESLFIELRGLFYTSHEETKKINFLLTKKNISKVMFFDSKHIINLTNLILLQYQSIYPLKFSKLIKKNSSPSSNSGYLKDSWSSISIINSYDINANSLTKIIKNFFKTNIKYYLGKSDYYKSLSDIYYALNPEKIKKKNNIHI